MRRTAKLSNMKTVIFFLTCALLVRRTPADEGSGCPSYGCLPSGTFALSSDIPGGQNQAVGIRWTTLVSGQTDKVSRQGCLSCQEGVVCVTHSGYVSVDQLKGDMVWRYDNMTLPSLPVLDIDGDVIGTDGRHIAKIDADGTVEKPIIKIYGHKNPMFSIMLTSDDLMLLTSYTDGILITYGTDGIPEASLEIRGVVERVNGSFLPVAQPVIYGLRAYILMEFVPDNLPLDASQAQVLGLQRLYAVDLWRRMVERISPVWYVNFERETKRSHGNHVPGAFSSSSSSSVPSYGNSVLVHNDTVYVSLGRPQGDRSENSGGEKPGIGDDEGTLWAIRDNGTEPEVIFKILAPVSSLSLYDVTVGHQRLPSWDKRISGFYRRHQQRGADEKMQNTATPILWAATSTHITGYNPRNGTVTYIIDVSKLLNVTCRVTSKVMVARSHDSAQERLLFAVSEDGNSTNTGDGRVVNTTMPYVVAANVDLNTEKVQMLWKVAGKPGTEIVGQIPNMLVVPPKGRKGGKARGGGGVMKGRRGVWDDVEVLLVATAVSKEAQFSFAIGQV